jgi:hypothetical protein
MLNTVNVSVRGKIKSLPACRIDDVVIITSGRFLKKAEIFDEFWIEKDIIPNPEQLIQGIQKSGINSDLLIFSQKIPDVIPKYNYYHEIDNFAVAPLLNYEQWFKSQIPEATRRNIRASEKRGIVVYQSDYNDQYVNGIMSIYNETPFRAGRKYWHYGKDFETVKAENGTYADRSTFFAAFYQGEMVGYLKLVWDKDCAAIMQILSKISVRNLRPNNALLAEAVKECCHRNIKYLIYEKYDYGNKTGDSLTKFKQSNGFVRMDIPKYFVPLTMKGKIALQLGLHKSLMESIPESIAAPLRLLRIKWYERKFSE